MSSQASSVPPAQESPRGALLSLLLQGKWDAADVAEAQRLVDQIKDPNNHWLDILRSASSADGLTWSKDGNLIRSHATHPEAALFPDGTTGLYFVDTDLDGLVRHLRVGDYDIRTTGMAGANFGLRCMMSTDGRSFTEESGFRIEGLRGLAINAPTVAVLADGRYRLYFIARNPGSQGWPTGRDAPRQLQSAVSSDGLRWEMEPGSRLEQPEGVVRVRPQPDGSYRAFAHRGHTFLSEDGGLTFQEEHPPIDLPVLNPSPVETSGGGWRMYYGVLGDNYGKVPNRTGGRITSAVSSDGRSWQHEPGYRLTVAFQPAALALPDRSVKLYYVGDE